MSVQAVGNYQVIKTNNISNAKQSGNKFTPLFHKNFASNTLVPERKSVIGDFKQGYLNDCWLCAIAKSLSQTSDGSIQLSEMIKKNNDNTYTVTFPNNVKFTVTEQEIKDDKVRNIDGQYLQKESLFYLNSKSPFIKFVYNPYITYSKGDENLKILEVAANKYVHKLVDEKVKAGLIPEVDRGKYSLDNYPIDEKLLFGNMSRYLTCSIDIGSLKPSEILMVGTDSNSALNNLKGIGTSHHAYTVKSIDKTNKTISLIDPQDTKAEPLVISFDDFYKRYSYISLKGNYKDTVNKTNVIKEAGNFDFARKTMDIASKQSPGYLAQAYITATPELLAELGEKDLQAKYIANVIDLSSQGIGTEDDCFKGAVYSIKNNETLNLVNKQLRKIPNPTYSIPNNGETILEKYINEEFSFNSKQELLNYIEQIKKK